MSKEKADEKKQEWKKRAVEFVDLKIGSSIEGKFAGVKKVGERTNEESGEVTDVLCAHFESPDGKTFKINYTKGLAQAMAESDVKEGEYIKVDRLEKIPHPTRKGQTINQYDIFVRG